MMREVRVKLDPAAIARLVEAHQRIAQVGRRAVVDAQIALAAKRDARAPRVDLDVLPRGRCAAESTRPRRAPAPRPRPSPSDATRYTDGNCGSPPVVVMKESAAGSHCAACQSCSSPVMSGLSRGCRTPQSTSGTEPGSTVKSGRLAPTARPRAPPSCPTPFNRTLPPRPPTARSPMMLWLVATGFFMQTLDSTIVNTALPAMATSLGEAPLRMQGGRDRVFADDGDDDPGVRLARRQTRHAHTSFSARSSSSRSARCCARMRKRSCNWWSIACVQGVGGAMLLPVGRLAVLRAFPAERYLSALVVRRDSRPDRAADRPDARRLARARSRRGTGSS